MSIRARLLVATAIIALVALVAADIATYAALRSFLYGQIDNSLELSHRTVESSISGTNDQAGGGGGPPNGPGAPPQSCPTFDGARVNTQGLSPGTIIEVRDPANRTVYRCAIATLGTDRVYYPILPATITGFSANAADFGEAAVYFTAPTQSGGDGFRVRTSVLRGGPESGGELIVAVPLSGTVGILDRLRDLELVVTGGALLVALALGWWLVRASLRPLRDVERTADAIAAGQLTERVPGDQTRTEVGRVARAFNVMLERIQQAFAQRDQTEADLRASEERMRRFVGDASHELRTPLAAVRAYAELFDRGAADRPDDLRRVIHGIQTETGRMSHLVEDLLLLARLDEGRPLHLEPIDLVALAADAVATASVLGPAWPVRLEATRPVEVWGDGLRIRQVIDNLLGNVRVHCPAGTTVTVRVSDEGAGAAIEVSDDGPGLGPGDAQRIFERFFRADPSRSRHHGGAGLGLAIVDAIVRAHGGTVTVGPASAGGARFTVRLPERPPGGAGHRPRAGSGSTTAGVGTSDDPSPAGPSPAAALPTAPGTPEAEDASAG